MAKQEVKAVRDEKESELRGLRARLADLQSESSVAAPEREHSVVLARAITANNRPGLQIPQTNSARNTTSGRISRSKIDDIKQRFRDRSAAKQGNSVIPAPDRVVGQPRVENLANGRQNASAQNNSLYRTAGEEMFQHLDFYERSLKAIEN